MLAQSVCCHEISKRAGGDDHPSLSTGLVHLVRFGAMPVSERVCPSNERGDDRVQGVIVSATVRVEFTEFEPWRSGAQLVYQSVALDHVCAFVPGMRESPVPQGGSRIDLHDAR